MSDKVTLQLPALELCLRVAIVQYLRVRQQTVQQTWGLKQDEWGKTVWQQMVQWQKGWQKYGRRGSGGAAETLTKREWVDRVE